MPASYLATPADVIKTRIQVSTRLRDNMYVDVIQTSKKMLREEGFKSFFKGGPARVLRSSPQFGITLCIFDLLKSVLND